jgi:hypothetical protein
MQKGDHSFSWRRDTKAKYSYQPQIEDWPNWAKKRKNLRRGMRRKRRSHLVCSSPGLGSSSPIITLSWVSLPTGRAQDFNNGYSKLIVTLSVSY